MNAMYHLLLLRYPLVLLVGLSLSCATVQADKQLDDQFPPNTGTADHEVIEKYEKQLKKIQQELEYLKIPVPAELSLTDDGVACLLDSPYFAQFRSSRTQQRFLIGRLVVLNHSSKPLEVKTKNIRLNMNGKEYRIKEKDLTPSPSFRIGNRHYAISELKPSDIIKIPAGHVASSWVVFNKLPAGNDVPNLTLHGEIGKQIFSLDASLQHRALLRWRREQIGPFGIISLCTIKGEINSINIGTVIDDFVTVATQNITRVIVQFSEDAPEVDSHLMQWLQLIASQAGRVRSRNTSSEFPIVPAMIRQIHLANLPDKTTKSYSSSSGPSQIHKTLNDAIVAISQSAYESISVSELVKEIHSGNPLTKPAALTHGAPRLPNAMLPEIIALSQQKTEPLLRIAALISLSEFNHPQAIDALSRAARSDDETVSKTALASLGASRFPAHQIKIMELLKGSLEFQQRVVRVLAQYPRKRWAETLYQHARSGPVSLQIDALKALNAVGHSGLQDLLITFLHSENKELQQASLEILRQRTDRPSREAVLKYALQELEKGTPDIQTFQVLAINRTQAAIPGLLALLKTDEKQRSAIISTLATIGNEKVLDTFIEIYPDLKQSQDRVAVLRAMQKIDQHRFLKFAPSALNTKDLQVVSNITNFLRVSANEQAVDIMIDAIRTCEDNDPRLSYLVTALGYLSTPRSRKFLVKLRDSELKTTSRLARSALQNIYARSPASYLYNQAVNTSRTGNYTLAVKQFTLAIESDPYYPQAYEGRAICYKRLEQSDNALTDYKQLIKLDAHWPNAHGAAGQILTSLSRFDEAVKMLSIAIEQKSEIPEKPKVTSGWYSSRGHAYSMLENFDKAESDYRKSLELDPENETALTGIALSLAINGKIEEAISQIKNAPADFKENSIFAYNVACIYSRAAEYLQKHPTGNPEQKKRVDQLIEKSLDELDRSISLGYKDVKWTVADPDLAILKEHDRFEKLLAKMEKKKEEK